MRSLSGFDNCQLVAVAVAVAVTASVAVAVAVGKAVASCMLITRAPRCTCRTWLGASPVSRVSQVPVELPIKSVCLSVCVRVCEASPGFDMRDWTGYNAYVCVLFMVRGLQDWRHTKIHGDYLLHCQIDKDCKLLIIDITILLYNTDHAINKSIRYFKGKYICYIQRSRLYFSQFQLNLNINMATFYNLILNPLASARLGAFLTRPAQRPSINRNFN